MRSKNLIILGGTLILSITVFSKENRNCGQPFRQLTAKSAQVIASMICTLQANNLTEKQVRIADNSENFVHHWNVQTVDGAHVIDGVCAASIKRYDDARSKPIIVHPGYRLRMALPNYEDLCDFQVKGSLTEIVETASVDEKQKESLIDKAQSLITKAIAKQAKRDVIVKFRDTGFFDDSHSLDKNSNWGSNAESQVESKKNQRILSHISLGMNVMSIFRGKLSGATLNEGWQDRSNKIGMGAGLTMTYQQFFKQGGANALTTSYSDISARFIFSKSLEPSLANRDIMLISGSQNELYVRQNGLMNMDEDFDDRTEVQRRYEDVNNKYDSSKSQSASNVFYSQKIAAGTDTYGCTMYSYDGDRNLVTQFNVQDCRRQIRIVGW